LLANNYQAIYLLNKGFKYKYCNKRAQHENHKKKFKEFHFVYSILYIGVYYYLGLFNSALYNMIKIIGTGILLLN